MAILTMHPHTLSYLSVTEGYRDENGDYHKGGSRWVEGYMKCDAVPSGEENVLTYEDGTQTHYSYIIYAPKDCREFKRNDVIRIDFYGQKPGAEFTIKGFHRYQHQCKIWV